MNAPLFRRVTTIAAPSLMGLLLLPGCDMRRIAEDATAQAEALFEDCDDQDIDDIWDDASEGFHDAQGRDALAHSCYSFRMRLGEYEGIKEVRGIDRSRTSDGDIMTLNLLVTYEVDDVEVTYRAAREDGEWLHQGFAFEIEEADRMDADLDALRALADAQRDRLVNGEYDAFVHQGFSFQTAMTTEQLTTGMNGLLQRHTAINGTTFRSTEPVERPDDDKEQHSVFYDVAFPTGTGTLRLTYEWAGAGWEFLSFDLQPPNTGGPTGNPAPTMDGEKF